MKTEDFFLIEMVFFFGIVLAFAAWQIWDARPDPPAKPEKKPQDQPGSGTGGGSAT